LFLLSVIYLYNIGDIVLLLLAGERFGRLAEGLPNKFGEGASGTPAIKSFSRNLQTHSKTDKSIPPGLPFDFLPIVRYTQ